MKKTTKLLLVLAAVVAMTIGAVSTVMAADMPVIDVSTWECTDGWYAKDTDGNQIKSGWAVDPYGRYYYFSSSKALENTFITWKGEIYYFGYDCIMCEGWVKFTPDNAVVCEADNDGLVDSKAILNGDSDNAYGNVVWCYFTQGGAAARNEWVDVDGLWYYFEDIIMICDTYSYYVSADKRTYGFSGNGNMHVGWIKAAGAKYAETPYEGSNSFWVYYYNNGTIAEEGWNKIDGEWYYFIDSETGLKVDTQCGVKAGTAVLLTNYFGKVSKGADNGTAVYYFDDNGVMQTGAVTIAKNKYVTTSITAFLNLETTTRGYFLRNTSSTSELCFTSAGALRTNYVSGLTYYGGNSSAAYYLSKDYSVNDTVIETNAATTIFDGQKLYNAFRINGGYVYYFDANGEMVKNDVVTFGAVTIAFDGNGRAIIKDATNGYTYAAGRYYYFGSEFGTVTVGGITINGCSVKKASSTPTASGSAISVN